MTRKRVFVACSVLGLVAAGAITAFYLIRGLRESETDADETLLQPAAGFTGNSTELKRTLIVPTLDTPLPEGKNAIWCASFQLAWSRLAKDVIHGPPEVANAEEVAARLNSAKVTEADLPENACYAAAGFTADGIVENIRTEMQRRFEKQPKIELDSPGTAIVAYGYLQASVRFKIPYFDNQEEFLFHESDGEKRPVASFGIREKDEYAYEKLRAQVEILHIARMPRKEWIAKEFVIDPCRNSSPNQIVLACVDPQKTLAATWEYVKHKMAYNARPSEFIVNDVLLIPNQDWDVAHRFVEIEGGDKRLRNKGFDQYWIDSAIQTIRFKLDRSGAELVSEAAIPMKPMPTMYIFDRPFLIAIRKRGCEQPFFVMWVANSELLLPPK